MTDQTALESTMIGWRHDLHRHPELGFEERRTAALIAEALRSFGLEVAEGVGGTGVVGTLKRGTSNRAIALRADIDALRISERQVPNGRRYYGQCLSLKVESAAL